MSDQSKVPPTLGNGARQGVEIPAVDLAGVSLTVGAHPRDASKRAIMVGPVMLVLPLDAEAARAVAGALTGIELVPASGLPKSPLDVA